MHTTDYAVSGLTCEHCVNAVTEELSALPGVDGVAVKLVPSGISTVTVTSEQSPSTEDVAGALDEAGDYVLA